MRKQYITDKGKAWSGITLDDSSLLSLTKKIIKKSKWKGGIELEMIKTKDNEYHLIEINPVFLHGFTWPSGQGRIFRRRW